MAEESLKLIVPKEIDNRINPEYRRHVKKFDMLSMPRLIKNVSKTPPNLIQYEVGMPLGALDKEGNFFFSKAENTEQQGYNDQIKKDKHEKYGIAPPSQYLGDLPSEEVQRLVDASKKKEEDNIN